MKKVIKGKIKYNFWIGLGNNLPLFMTFCIALVVAIGGILKVFEPGYFDNQVPPAFVITGFALYITICYVYGRYYRYVLRQWDKPGYEILMVDGEARTICFDNQIIVPLAEIESIRLEKCNDSLPRIPKSYDVINARAVIKLLNGDRIEFYMQKLSWIYDMIKYFGDMHIRVEADEFEHNKRYKLQANNWKINLTLALIVISYMIYQMHKSGIF